MDTLLRCPHCNALVVDRRSPTCTTCRQALPAEWIMSTDQTQKLNALERDAEEQHAESMKAIEQIDTHVLNTRPGTIGYQDNKIRSDGLPRRLGKLLGL